MPVFALYNFDDADTTARDSALGNGAQDGHYLNGAAAAGGQAVLDGEDDLVKIYANPAFQMDRGTLDINFSLGADPLTGTQTVLSRDSAGSTDGGYRIEIQANGAVVISHETPTGVETFGTAPGFAHPGDSISLNYSWDQGGAGGVLNIDNATTGGSFTDSVPNTLTMDMSGQGINQPWIIGAGQSHSDPNILNNIDQHFQGSVTMFQLSDTVDNGEGNPDAVDDLAETDEDTPVTIPVLANDTDPEGQPLTVTEATAPNGTVTVNPDGTITYMPNPDFNGEDTITYTVTDPDGNEDTATVTVTVNPVNDAPVAADDASTTPLNTPITFAVMANDTDVDGDTLSILGTPTSADGTITVNADGTLTFTPNAGFTGDAVVNYTVTDPEGLTDSASWTITVGTAPDRDGIVRGTDGGDLIDGTYVDPFDGDRVDAGDAILPGDGPNDDRILAGAGNDTVLAGLGNDSVEGGDGDDSIRGGVGDDTLFGQAGDDTLRGGDGDDVIYGGLGNDVVRGGAGNDLIDTSGGRTPLPDQDYPGLYPADSNPNDDRDLVYGGAGDDTIRTGDDADTIYGGFGNDSIEAGFDDDLVDGNQGDDTIIGGEGNDTIDGGQGDDLIYGGYGPGVPDAVNIPDATDLRPNNGRDDLYGGMGNDTIYGMDDDDTIHGGQGNDLVYGGIDDDLIYGEAGNDILNGDDGNDTIYGGLGNDTINGGAGADLLHGNADRDTFVVGSQANGIGDTIYGGASGDDFDTLDLRGTGPYRLTGVTEDSDGNGIDGTVEFLDADGNVTGSLVFTNIEEIIPCFTPGTLIATAKGEVAVEHLKAGDRVITRDNGIQEIRWVGQKTLGWKDLAANPHLKPVLIRQGSLGNGLPERDMMVSPNHRMLVANDRTALYFDEHEVLVSAKHLVAANGIQSIDSIGTTYLHFMFDRHEVVLGNGAWTESFQPGDLTLKGMGNAQRNEIFELFPELKTDVGVNEYQAARRTLKRHEASLLVK
jgi:CshA-type fibril repeat protein